MSVALTTLTNPSVPAVEAGCNNSAGRMLRKHTSPITYVIVVMSGSDRDRPL